MPPPPEGISSAAAEAIGLLFSPSPSTPQPPSGFERRSCVHPPAVLVVGEDGEEAFVAELPGHVARSLPLEAPPLPPEESPAPLEAPPLPPLATDTPASDAAASPPLGSPRKQKSSSFGLARAPEDKILYALERRHSTGADGRVVGEANFEDPRLADPHGEASSDGSAADGERSTEERVR